ncbi:NAD(P)H dehydrogenase (quinone) [Azospirillum lipoferum]|nr:MULTISPECIES: NAD(P)H:quinone oxidoreductase [Azospirillum]MCP1610943.1 NAD(P)H dehydrogenase (quinone) [Azospirillum lipoferum]MDW5533918.1 NAD(P)H:quinone oxidoreductase [Azospirillum sp. NL1]
MTMATPKILIVFYSRNGSTAALAEAVAEGARALGAEVRLRRAREMVGPEVMAMAQGWAENAAAMNETYGAPTADDAVWADAIIFGTPTRFGGVASELKAYIDGLGGVWFQGKLNGKLGGVFGSTSSKHGGNESTLLSIYTVMAHLGLIIVPLGYSHPALFKAGTPYGATFISQGDTKKPGDEDLAVARYQGERIAQLAGRIAEPVSSAA